MNATTRHHHHAFVSHEEALLGDSSRAARKQRGKLKPKCSIEVSWLLGRTPLRSVSVLCLHKAALTARQQKAFFPSEIIRRIGGYHTRTHWLVTGASALFLVKLSE